MRGRVDCAVRGFLFPFASIRRSRRARIVAVTNQKQAPEKNEANEVGMDCFKAGVSDLADDDPHKISHGFLG